MSDTARLTTYYAELPDEELREIASRGAAAFRPEVWTIIVGELARRQLRGRRGRRGARAAEARTSARADEKSWSLGMRVALLPAVATIALVGKVLVPLGSLRVLLVAPFCGYCVWVGVGTLVDLVQHRRMLHTRRGGRDG